MTPLSAELTVVDNQDCQRIHANFSSQWSFYVSDKEMCAIDAVDKASTCYVSWIGNFLCYRFLIIMLTCRSQQTLVSDIT